MNPPQSIPGLLQHSITPLLRSFITPLLRFLLIAAILLTATSAKAETLRIGYQKATSTLVLLKVHGSLEKKLAPLNVEVKWLEFAAGPQHFVRVKFVFVGFGEFCGSAPIFSL